MIEMSKLPHSWIERINILNMNYLSLNDLSLLPFFLDESDW